MKQLSILILIAFCLFSCKTDTPPPAEKKGPVSIPAFNGDNAYANIEKQLSFGYRIPGTEAHRNQIEWMVSTFEGLGAQVSLQNFEASFLTEKDVPCTNVMAQFNPEHHKRVLLAAHFDSRLIAEKDPDPSRRNQPIMGADDGASGVAVLLEIAKMISENPIDLGVDFLMLDAEDQGESGSGNNESWCLGSQVWSRDPVPGNYDAKFGILLDMVGSDKATFGKEDYSKYYVPELQNKIWTLAKRMGYSDLFQDFNAGGVMDDHYYINQIAKIPMVNIINIRPDERTSFGDYHHTHADDIDIISPRTLRVVGQVVAAVLYKESDGTFN